MTFPPQAADDEAAGVAAEAVGAASDADWAAAGVAAEAVGAASDADWAAAGVAAEAVGAVTDAEWAAAVTAVRGLAPGDEIQLVCHVNPDGDALGSMLGFGLGLVRLGFAGVRATFPGEFEVPDPYRELPGSELLAPATTAYEKPRLTLIFDVASESRLGSLVRLLAGPSVVLDHHASNTRFGQVNLVDPGAAATSVVAEGLLRRLDVPLDAAIAECLYVALATDTGSFKFDMTTPAVHALAARLIATGLRPGEISRRTFDSKPFGAMKLVGEVLDRAVLDRDAAAGHGLVWTWSNQDDLVRHAQRPYVLDTLIDPVRSVAEADVAILLKELAAGEWSVSLRSKGAVDVSRVAVSLGGGGHRLAAGFTASGTPDEVLGIVRPLLDANLT